MDLGRRDVGYVDAAGHDVGYVNAAGHDVGDVGAVERIMAKTVKGGRYMTLSTIFRRDGTP